MSSFIRMSASAKKAGKKSFKYKGRTYRLHHKGELSFYKRSGSKGHHDKKHGKKHGKKHRSAEE